MAKKSKNRKRITDVKAAAAHDDQPVEQTPAPIIPAEVPQARVTAEQIATGTVVSARTAAIRRSQAGKFNKGNLTVIGGAECPRFYPMTWVEHDSGLELSRQTLDGWVMRVGELLVPLAEPPFGWIKHVLGFRRFSLRGHKEVQGEW